MATKTDLAIVNVQNALNSEKCLTALQSACASNISPKRLIKTTESLIRKTKELQDCSVTSIYGAVLECATLGLEPILGRAYFVPFRTKEGTKDLQLIIGYQGLIELGRRGGVEAKANAVFEGDELIWESGFEESLIHRPKLGAPRDADHLTFVYCVWKFAGEKHVEVMTRDEVEKIKNCSKCRNFGPWKDFYVEMAKKTVVRRAAKYWPLTVNAEIADAIERDDDRLFQQEEEKPSTSGVDALRARLGMTSDKVVEVETIESRHVVDGFFEALTKSVSEDEIMTLIDQVEMANEAGEVTDSDLRNFVDTARNKITELTGTAPKTLFI